MTVRGLRGFASFVFAAALAACSGGGSGGATSTGGRACIPGQSVACVGGGGCKGGQVCSADGSGYGACDCGTGTSGSGGAASATSSGGTGGTSASSASGTTGKASGSASSTGSTTSGSAGVSSTGSASSGTTGTSTAAVTSSGASGGTTTGAGATTGTAGGTTGCGCQPPTTACVSGSCVCADAGSLCGGACVDAQTDPLNCGFCGTSCADGVCVGGVCATITPLAQGPGANGAVWGLGVDSAAAYFMQETNNGPFSLVQAALDGGGATSWPTAGCGADFTLAPTGIYGSCGGVGLTPLDGGKLIALQSEPPGTNGLTGLALTSNTLYASWTTSASGEVTALPLAGGDAGVVFADPKNEVVGVAAAQGELFVAEYDPASSLDSVLSVAGDGGTAIASSIDGNVIDLFSDGRYVYWIDNSYIQQAGYAPDVVGATPVTGGAVVTFPADAQYPLLGPIAADGTTVYWIAQANSGDQILLSAPSGGGPVTTLYDWGTNPVNVAALAVDSTSVYWLSQSGLVKMTPK